jgi:hypothetical protein
MVHVITCDKATTELSSLLASSTMSLLGRSLRRRIAVAKSSGLKSRKKDHESLTQISFIKRLDGDKCHFNWGHKSKPHGTIVIALSRMPMMKM